MDEELTPLVGYEQICEQAVRVAGGPGDIPQRVAILLLTKLVLRPLVRFPYFTRTTAMLFRDFGDTELRAELAPTG